MNRAWLIVALTSLMAIGGFLVADELRGACFVDELMSVEGAWSFFHEGEYTAYPNHLETDPYAGQTGVAGWRRYFNGPFTPGMSIGIASSWPSGLAWGTGGRLIYTRFASLAYCLLLALALGWLGRRSGLFASSSETFAISSLLFLLTTLAVPYSVDAIRYSLGEVSGALILGIGIWTMLKSPKIGAFLVGICVWHTKLIYLPFALVALGAQAFAKKGAWKGLAFAFLLPLIAWLILLGVEHGPLEVIHWLEGRTAFLIYGNSGFDQPPAIHGLWNRLASPDLEWSGYDPRVRAKILLTLFGPIPLLLLTALRARLSGPRGLVALGAVAAFLLFGAWYFLWHPTMWLRHIVPAMLVGWGTLTYYGLLVWRRIPERPRAYAAVTVSLALLGWQGYKTHAFYLDLVDKPLYSLKCGAGQRGFEGPFNLPECRCGG